MSRRRAAWRLLLCAAWAASMVCAQAPAHGRAADTQTTDVLNALRLCEWQLEASSYLVEGVGPHPVQMLADDSTLTAWNEGAKGFGIGETVTYRFLTCGSTTFTLTLTGFEIMNGYWKSPDLFTRNGRAKELHVLYEGQRVGRLMLQDAMKVQVFRFSHPVAVTDGAELVVQIADVYPGSQYEDTCITEMHPLGFLTRVR